MRVSDHMALELFKATENFRKDPQANAVYLKTLVNAHSAQIRNAVLDKRVAKEEGRFVANLIFDGEVVDDKIVFGIPE